MAIINFTDLGTNLLPNVLIVFHTRARSIRDGAGIFWQDLLGGGLRVCPMRWNPIEQDSTGTLEIWASL